MTCLRKITRIVWHYLREVSGENDYERYRVRARASGLEVMTAEAFYLVRLRQKYLRPGPSRCC